MSELADALDATAAYLRGYVVFPSPQEADAAALWVGHTWTYDQFDTTAYLAIQSPEKRSGKSRLLECLRLVAREPVPMAGASLAALFRIIDERHPTLLLDEADTIFNKRGATAPRTSAACSTTATAGACRSGGLLATARRCALTASTCSAPRRLPASAPCPTRSRIARIVIGLQAAGTPRGRQALPIPPGRARGDPDP